MSRRYTTFIAAIALIQQLLVPALAEDRAGGDAMVICTADGLVTIPGQPVPAGAGDRAGLKHAGCHAVCPGCGARRRNPTRRR